ncbi:unnamed protein product [Oppiella nova]|uniref:GST C-terminal domain-containing protein n=1 Tax=Oppiella nova TaxID=334625 RepID=A0A7R9QLY5_9ACAR|nr:unnamed protein product [Oppiella nova]CAG2168223.1 unnamed protein product [Oppiella nova]
MVEQQLQDIKTAFLATLINDGGDDAKWKAYCTGSLKTELTLLVKYSAMDKQWLCGQLSYVDFMAYEMLDGMRAHYTNVDRCRTFTQYCERFEALPAIKAYRSSSEFTSGQ